MSARRLQHAILGILLAAVLSLAGCTSTVKGSSIALSVVLTDFTFQPATFTIPANQEISVSVTNKGANVHEFVIMKPGVKVDPPFGDKDEGNIYWEVDDVQPGQTKTGKFMAPGPGTYEIVCGQPKHIEMGMVGTLTVSP